MNDIITINPERRDPGFLETKSEIGLGNVDNLSYSALLETLVTNARQETNRKKISGEISDPSNQGFLPLFKTSNKSSTCSLEVGFYKEDKEISSFSLTFSFYLNDLSYNLTLAPNSEPLQNLYLRFCLKDEYLVGGIYWELANGSIDFKNNFSKIGINLLSWTEGAEILDPSINQFTEYNPTNQSGKCSLIGDILLENSSSNINNEASSFAIFDKITGRRVLDSEKIYTSAQIENLDVPTINGVPFLLQQGSTVDNKSGRQIEITAKHKGPSLMDAGAHNWEVLQNLKRAGLIQNIEGAVPTVSDIPNSDLYEYGVTRLSKYNKLDLTEGVSVDTLETWLDSLGQNTDVISVGLFKNFLGYLGKIISSSSTYTLYDFSLEDSKNECMFLDYLGDTEGIELYVNSYKTAYSGSTGTSTAVLGSDTLMKIEYDGDESIIESASLEAADNFRIKLTLKIKTNSEAATKSVTLKLKQLEGSSATGKEATITIFQSGYEKKYGVRIDNSPYYSRDGFTITKQTNSFNETYSIVGIESLPEGGYTINRDLQLQAVLDNRAKSWCSLTINSDSLLISGSENINANTRVASGYILIKDGIEILEQVPVTIKQHPAQGFLNLSVTEAIVPKAQGDITVNINSNYPWTIDINSVPSWITLRNFSGSGRAGETNLDILYSNNISSEKRNCSLVFINDYGNTANLNITQYGKENYVDVLGFPDTDVIVPMNSSWGKKVTITFETDVDWVIDHKPAWIDVDYSSGPKAYRHLKSPYFTLTYNTASDIDLNDYVSIGYVDKTSGVLKSLRKIYVNFNKWVTSSSSGIPFDSRIPNGAYIFGGLYKELSIGQTDTIFCVANRSQLPEVDPEYNFNIQIEGQGKDYFYDQNWTEISNSEINLGIKYPDLSGNFGIFYKTATVPAPQTDEDNYFKNLRTIEGAYNSPGLLNISVTRTGFDNYIYINSLGTELDENSIISVRKILLDEGLSISTEENTITAPKTITLSGNRQTFSIWISPKTETQAVFNPYLTNETLPGWIFLENLIDITSISDIESSKEKRELKITVLPNRTIQEREIELFFTDRGLNRTQTSFRIIQQTLIPSIGGSTITSRRLIFETRPGDYDNKSKKIKIGVLTTYEETYGNYRKARRELSYNSNFDETPTFSDVDWGTISKEGQSYYINLEENNTRGVRKGTVTAKIDGQNYSLDIYQPSEFEGRHVSPEYTVENLNVNLLKEYGSSINKKLPLTFYESGYSLSGTMKVTYVDKEGERHDDVITEGVFPFAVDDLVVSNAEGSVQEFDFSTPLGFTRHDPVGIEPTTLLNIELYGATKTLTIYNEETDLPFELDYSLVSLSSDPVEMGIKLNAKSNVVFNNGNIKIGSDPVGQDNSYIRIKSGILDGGKVVVRESTTSTIVPGTIDTLYSSNYGISTQRPLAEGPIEINKTNGTEDTKFILTIIPSRKTGELTVETPETSTLDNDLVKHGYEIPHILQVSGISVLDGKDNYSPIFDTFGGILNNPEQPNITQVDLKFDGNTSFQNVASPFNIPYCPVSIRLRDSDLTKQETEKYIVNLKAQSIPVSSTYITDESYDRLDNKISGIDIQRDSTGEITKLTLKRLSKGSPEDISFSHYCLYFDGIPCGVTIEGIESVNGIASEFLKYKRQEGSAPSTTPLGEVRFIYYSKGDVSEYCGSYKEINTTNIKYRYSRLEIQTFWRSNRSGGILVNKETEFQIANLKFKFTYYNDQGKKIESIKSYPLYFEEVHYEPKLISPTNGKIYLRWDKKTSGVLYVDVNNPTTYDSEYSYLTIEPRKYWFIKETENQEHYNWKFNSKDYTDYFDPNSGNCGYVTDTSLLGIGARISPDDELIDRISAYTETEIDPNTVSKFKLYNSSNASVDWDSLSGPEIEYIIAPAKPYFSIEGDDILFMMNLEPGSTEPKQYIMRAVINLVDCSYNQLDETLLEVTDDFILHQVPVFSGEDEGGFGYDNRWKHKISYIPSENSIYYMIGTCDDQGELAPRVITYDSSKSRKFGNITVTLNDAFTLAQGTNEYDLSSNARCVSPYTPDGEQDPEYDPYSGSDWYIEGEVILREFIPQPSETNNPGDPEIDFEEES